MSHSHLKMYHSPICHKWEIGKWYIFQWQMGHFLYIFGYNLINIQVFSMLFRYICSKINNLSETSNACQHCVMRFDNTWFLLCLEMLRGHWSAATWLLLCLEALHSDCFCCTWLLLCLEVLPSHWNTACSLAQQLGHVAFVVTGKTQLLL